jgi:CheY-like chemotaxis protein
MPYKLLLADDSVTIQRVIELTFADEDVQVIAVGDGKQAIERIEADRPDIVLADVGMPERDGYEVAAFVKNTPHLSHIPVLLLTGAFEPVDEKRASDVGCDGVLAKPFEPHMVITRVKELLADASAGPAARARRMEDPGAGRPGAAALVPLAPELGSEHDEHASSAGPAPQMPDPQVDAASATPAAGPTIPAALIGSPMDASVRISRRTPIAVPGFGSPAPPSSGDSSAALDDYFDRLDAAFATLQQTPAAPAPEAEESAGAAAIPASPASFVSVSGADTLQPEQAQPGADALKPGPRLDEPAEAPAASGVQPSAPPLGIAQAFSAMFAAERGEAAPDPTARLFGGPALPQASPDDLVERVTRQVLERLSDRVVRDTVTEIVSRVAERLVREEIDRVKTTLR